MKKTKLDIAKNIAKNYLHNMPYKPYHPIFKPETITFDNEMNCFDEVCPGSHNRSRRLQELTRPVEYTDFSETYSRIVHEMHDILLEEFMLLNNWSEGKAKYWINNNVDFNKVHLTEKDGRKYLQVDLSIKWK